MKGQVAASAVAIASLAREGFRPAGDLIFVAAADEEVGDGFGLQWLCDEHPDAVRCDYAVNEGGGDRLELGRRVVYLCATAEKMTAPFTLRVHGRSGHASMPGIADNALVKAARLVERLAAYRPEPRAAAGGRGVPRGVLGERARAGDALDARWPCIRSLAELVEPLLAPTFAPTMISRRRSGTSFRRSARSSSTAVCCRARPGGGRPIVREVLGDGDYELEWLEAQGGTRSPLDTPLWDAVEASSRSSSRARARCRSAPRASPTATGCARRSAPSRTASSRRARWRPRSAARLIHSADERVPVDDLELGRRLAALRRARPCCDAERGELGAFAELEAYLADEGFCGRERRRRATSTSATASPTPLRRDGGACAARAVPAAAARVLRSEPTAPVRAPPRRLRVGDVGAQLGRRRPTPPRSRRCARRSRAGDVYQVNLVQHLSAPFDGDPARRSRPRSRRCGRSRRGRSSGDGWAIVSASPELFLARRGRPARTMPIKGTRPGGRATSTTRRTRPST